MSDGSTDLENSHSADESASSDKYVVVARRYRPQSFEQLVGQQQVSQALKNAIERNRVGHAYLFTGARGVGKTSSARILAKALNCEQGPTASPCNTCDICVSVTSGEDVDVLEIDGASNRGIEEIRQLRSNINIRPSRARFKIYIIDEVHMFTKEAFNALLKTLEEPPPHVKFIFCTTDPEKIPITVLSRCQRFDFGGIQPDAIVERLSHIVVSEGVSAEKEALHLLARRANGSMRDSQSLLEQLLAFGEKEITVNDVHRMLGTAGMAQLHTLTGALLQRDAATALSAMAKAITAGVDAGQLIEQLLGYYRDLMTTEVGCSADILQVVPMADFESLQESAKQYGLATIMAGIQVLDDTLMRMQRSTHATVLAEMAIVRLCRLDDLQSISDMLEAVRSGEPVPARPAITTVVNTTVAAPASVESPQVSTKPQESPNTPEPRPEPQKKTVDNYPSATEVPQEDLPEENRDKPLSSNALSLNSSNAKEIWDSILADMTDLLGDSARHYHDIAIPAPNRLVVSFFKSYTLPGTPRGKQRLEDLLSQACGQKITLEVKFIENQAPPQQSEEPTSSKPSPGQMIRSVQSSPFVQEAMELFGAEVVKVNPPKNNQAEQN